MARSCAWCHKLMSNRAKLDELGRCTYCRSILAGPPRPNVDELPFGVCRELNRMFTDLQPNRKPGVHWAGYNTTRVVSEARRVFPDWPWDAVLAHAAAARALNWGAEPATAHRDPEAAARVQAAFREAAARARHDVELDDITEVIA